MVHEKEPVLPLGNFLFPRIFQAFRIAIRPTNLLIALAALTILCLTGRIMDLSRTVVVDPGFAGTAAAVPPGATSEIRRPRGTTELDLYLLPDTTLTKNFIESRKGFIESKEAARAGVFTASFAASRTVRRPWPGRSDGTPSTASSFSRSPSSFSRWREFPSAAVRRCNSRGPKDPA
jgi:hypothetical protein